MTLCSADIGNCWTKLNSLCSLYLLCLICSRSCVSAYNNWNWYQSLVVDVVVVMVVVVACGGIVTVVVNARVAVEWNSGSDGRNCVPTDPVARPTRVGLCVPIDQQWLQAVPACRRLGRSRRSAKGRLGNMEDRPATQTTPEQVGRRNLPTRLCSNCANPRVRDCAESAVDYRSISDEAFTYKERIRLVPTKGRTMQKHPESVRGGFWPYQRGFGPCKVNPEVVRRLKLGILFRFHRAK